MQRSHSAKSECSVKKDHGYRIGGSELFHAEFAAEVGYRVCACTCFFFFAIVNVNNTSDKTLY